MFLNRMNPDTHPFTRANLNRAQEVIEVMADYNLQMILPKGMPILQALVTGNSIRLDNVFTSTSFANAVVECREVLEEWPARSDHSPIDPVVEAGTGLTIRPARNQFRAAGRQSMRKWP